MEIADAIKQYGIVSVLNSLFPKLKGVDFDNVDYNQNTLNLSGFQSLLNQLSENWFFTITSFPTLCMKSSLEKIDDDVNKLLIKNNIDLKSSYSDPSFNGITFWDGDGFKVEKISSDDNHLIMITSVGSLTKKSILYQETKLAKKISPPDWISGFNHVFDSSTISKKNKNLSKFILCPILFKEEKDNQGEYIAIPVNVPEYAKPLIDKIIDDNGGRDAFKEVKLDSDLEKEWDYLHQGHIFTVGYLKDKSKRCVRINRLQFSAESISGKKLDSGIHPFNAKINSIVKGLNKQIFNPADGAVADGRFIAQSKDATNVVAFDKKSANLINKFKDVVNEYNNNDEFLRLSNESIETWMDRNPEETISFDVTKNFQLVLSKGRSLYRLNLFPPGGFAGNWESASLNTNQKKLPIVIFSKKISTKKISSLKDPVVPVEIKKPEKDEKTLKSEFVKKATISAKESDDYENNQKKKQPNYLNWLYLIIGIIILFMLLRTCLVDKDANYYFDRAMNDYGSGNFEKADKNFERAIDEDSSYRDAYVRRGEMNIDNGNYPDAKRDLDEAIFIDDSDWYAYYLRGLANMNSATSKYSRLNKDAINDFTKSIQLNPNSDNGKSYYYRGKVYQTVDDDKYCEDFYIACDYKILDACQLVDEFCYPETGYMPYNDVYGPGVYTGNSTFTISNNCEYDMVCTLKSTRTRRAIRSIFIRAGDEWVMDDVPPGYYVLEYLQGKRWIYTKKLSDGVTDGGFSEEQKFKEVNYRWDIDFNTSQGFENCVTDGTLTADEITEDQFFNK